MAQVFLQNWQQLSAFHGCFILARRNQRAGNLWRFSHASNTQAFPIDQYQDAHLLAAKMQAVAVKSTFQHLGPSHARLWPIIYASKVLYLLLNFFIFHDKISFNKNYSKFNILMSFNCSEMKDNLIWIILIKAVVCFSKKCKKPERFPQHLEMGSVCNPQAACDWQRLFTHTLRFLVWNDHKICCDITSTLKVGQRMKSILIID